MPGVFSDSLGALDPIIEVVMRSTWDSTALSAAAVDFTSLTAWLVSRRMGSLCPSKRDPRTSGFFEILALRAPEPRPTPSGDKRPDHATRASARKMPVTQQTTDSAI
jgi:hypothetical protein